jgi:FtsP/CotA-like multicopper oxidase with cupredoxin domain
LNAPLAIRRVKVAAGRVAEKMPEGCVGDLDPDLNQFEHRRVIFTAGTSAKFGIITEIVKPPSSPPPPSGKWNEEDFIYDKNRLVGDPDMGVGVSFGDYELPNVDGGINWDAANNGPKHACIHLDHKGSHKQLWVLRNWTGELHNFHIHQMKFRLATEQDLKLHHINPPQDSQTCENGPCYKLYEKDSPEKIVEWHDTIPVPGNADRPVFIIMSFDDENTQKGRFVYHCHILKHEDSGLMAPIEVWGP